MTTSVVTRCFLLVCSGHQVHAGNIDIIGQFPAARITQVLAGVKKIVGRLYLKSQVVCWANTPGRAPTLATLSSVERCPLSSHKLISFNSIPSILRHFYEKPPCNNRKCGPCRKCIMRIKPLLDLTRGLIWQKWCRRMKRVSECRLFTNGQAVAITMK